MSFPFEIEVKNFRSIQNGCKIPFNKTSTFAVGQNNSGKSNILRAVAAIFNKKYNSGDENSLYKVIIHKGQKNYASIPPRLERIIQEQGFEIEISRDGVFSSNTIDQKIVEYLHSPSLMDDIGTRSSNYEANLESVFRIVQKHIERYFQGTTYVPTTRFITKTNTEPDNFSNFDMPGETISYGRIIEELSEMDRPPTDRRELRESFRKLEDFVSFCLEKPNSKIQVPNNKKTIHITIDSSERPIQDLGTGVEQLVIIGLASLGFPRKLVLIDEPELHFHPRAQKRMIQYLNNQVDAKFVFATHSAAILDAIDADVLQVTYDGEKSIVRTITNSTEKYQAVRDLGHSPSELLQTRFAIWVEGPSDRIYLNNWILKIDPSLREGIDYTILFYGGKILSHHSFADENSELVKAVSLSRAFAVIMDSDRKNGKPNINSTKSRVRNEIQRQGGICWITEGREIENYLPNEIIATLSNDFPGTTSPKTKLDRVLDPAKVKKNEFARAAVGLETDEWPLDLKKRVTEIVHNIHMAR